MDLELKMGAYEIDLFNHNLSVDPEFRAGILAGVRPAVGPVAGAGVTGGFPGVRGADGVSG